MKALGILVAVFSTFGGSVPWVKPGIYVRDGTLYELRCAKTQEEFCSVLGIEQQGYIRVLSDSFHFQQDTECGDFLFVVESVTADAAEGVFVDAVSAGERPTLDPMNLDPMNYVQVWRDSDAIVMRGDLESLCNCNRNRRSESAVVHRYVPYALLLAAAEKRAAEIGIKVSSCNYKTIPRFRPGRCIGARGAKR